MESKSLADGGPRVKFTVSRKGTISDFLGSSRSREDFLQAAEQLACALKILETCGATPILPDGKLAGNGSVRVTTGEGDYLIVCKSGKLAGKNIDFENDMCVVTKFDVDEWHAEYYSDADSVLPTSDTPLHYCILNAHRKFRWTQAPGAALHGHTLCTYEEATDLGLPCSLEETLFSTPEDLGALLELAGSHAYPENQIYIRKGHGFFILGQDVQDAVETFRRRVEPYISTLSK